MYRVLAVACVPVVLLASACGDRESATAAAPPQIELRAIVSAPDAVTVPVTIDGRVEKLAVHEGSIVHTGDLLATLVNPSIDRDVAFARAQLLLAEQRLRAASAPAPRRVAEAADDSRERAAAEILKNREAKLARYRELFATHDVSREELENAENDYAAAKRDWLGERERRVVAPQAVTTDTGLLRLELEKARAEEALAQDRKGQLDVAAPIAGVVTKVHAREGAGVFPRDPLVDIANTSTVEVRAGIAPELLRYVRAGMPVEVKVFTVPPRRFVQRVRSVLPGSGSAGAMIVIELPNPDGVLQAGTNAVVTVKG